MLKRTTLTLAALPLCAPALAQQPAQSTFIETNQTARYGGTYHAASGTWTRNVHQAVGLSDELVYNNTASSSQFSTLGLDTGAESFEIIDSGRLPSAAGSPGANRDEYLLTEIEIGYCVGEVSPSNGPLTVQINLYESYLPCGDPTGLTPTGTILATDLPVGNAIIKASLSCWTVQVDLSGGMEVCMQADGNGVFDMDADVDSFGIGLEFDPGGVGGYVGSTLLGPLLAGDREFTARDAGELIAPNGTGGGGGGTYYGPTETCLPAMGGLNSSGLDNQDLLWVGYAPNAPLDAGCYWFGGYTNGVECNADDTVPQLTPHAGLHIAMRAALGDTCVEAGQVGEAFCDPANNNSSGGPAFLSASRTTAGIGAHLEVSGGPAGEFGYFVVGSNAETANPFMLSNGLVCLARSAPDVTGRYNYAGTPRDSMGQFDAQGVLQNLVGTSATGSGFDVPVDLPFAGNPMIAAGSTWHYQLWYRDRAAAIGSSNLSNGLTISF